MKVTVFTAADYVDSPGGKLTIVGAFDNFEVDDCPTLFKPFGVALKIIAEPHDKGKILQGRIVLRKVGTRKPLFGFGLGMHFEMASHERVNAIVMAINLVGIRFESFGEYHMDLLVGSRVRASTKLNVVKKAKPPLPVKDAPKKKPIKTKK
jgi:hypothetical protein